MNGSVGSPASSGEQKYVSPPHKDRVRNICGLEQLEAWKSFTDGFWRAAPAGIPTAKTEHVFRRGFKRDKWALYELQRNDAEEYISDFQIRMMPRANTIYSRVLENKVLLLQAASQMFSTPEIFCMRDEREGEVVFSERWAAAVDGGSTRGAVRAYVQPLDTSARGKTAVFDIAASRYEGAGRSGGISGLRGMVRDWAAAAGCPYLFTEYVEQGSFTSEMAPGGHNSLHLIICREHATWRPHLAAAVLRLGTAASNGSHRVENGAASFPVDIESGRIGAGAVLVRGGLRREDRHPDSNVPVAGATVPGWERVREQAVAFFDQSNYLRIAGFDFVLGDSEAVLIGGSNTPDVAAAQVHKPLLTDPVVSEFVRREKI